MGVWPLFGLVWLLSSSGCESTSLHCYEALGPSLDTHWGFITTELEPLCLLKPTAAEPQAGVMTPAAEEGMRPHKGPRRPGRNTRADAPRFPTVGDSIENMLTPAQYCRPANPTFRSLCGILNRQFGKWSRLVVIERMSYHAQDYDFIAIAITNNDVVGVTSMRWCGGEWGVWEHNRELVRLRVNREKLRASLEDLDKARATLPQMFIWHPEVDQPLFALYDAKNAPWEGGTWSIAVHAWAYTMPTTEHPFSERLDLAPAAALMREFGSTGGVPATREKDFDAATDVYLTLMNRVWEAAFDRPDVNRYCALVKRELMKPMEGPPEEWPRWPTPAPP